jgi:3-oxoacyl-[acyl-carrier-protein] synthase II
VAVVAAREAWAHAGLAGTDAVDPLRLAVIIGTGIGGALTLLGPGRPPGDPGPAQGLPADHPDAHAERAGRHVGLELGAQAGVHAPVSACASGAEALGLGLADDQVGRGGRRRRRRCRGCITSIPIAGFSQMRAMSTRNDEPERASRPFDVDRDGFVLGEGSGSWCSSARTSPGPAARPCTAGSPASARRPTAPHHAPGPDGSGASRAIAAALRTAGIDPRTSGT